MAMAAIMGVLVSCQSNTKTPESAGSDTSALASSTSVTDSGAAAAKPVKAVALPAKDAEIMNVSPTAAVKAPQFTNEDVNAGLARFEPLRQEYEKAIESKNTAKIAEITTKYNQWVGEAATWGLKLTKDENQIYIDHYTKLVRQWEKLSQRIKK